MKHEPNVKNRPLAQSAHTGAIVPKDDAAFKVRDAGSYDELVEDFERFTDSLTVPLATHLLKLAGIRPGDRILDIGTGTGVVVQEADRLLRAAPSTEKTTTPILGIDFSHPMIEKAKCKAQSGGFAERVRFEQMDAEALQLGDDSMDVVVSLFALLHFPNPLTALREIHRVLRPGGRMALAVGSAPPLLSPTGITHRLKRAPELLQARQGKLLTAPNFINALVNTHLPEPDEADESETAQKSADRSGSVQSLVREAGLKVVRSDWQGHISETESPEDFWHLQRTFSSIARKRLNDADEFEENQIRELFLKRCAEVKQRGGRLIYPYGAYFIVAEKSGR